MSLKTVDLERTLQMHLEEDEKLIKINIITFHTFWNILIGVQTFSITVMMMYILAYDEVPPSLLLTMFVCDIFYLADFIGALIYVKNWKTRRFLPYQPKNWKFFLIDIISLIPFAYTYETYVANENKSNLIFRILLQNRCLRIYRIFVLFSFYDLILRNQYQYLMLMATKFIALSILISHTMSCIWLNLPGSIPCSGSAIRCLIWREVSIFKIFLHHWSGDKIQFSSEWEMGLVIFVICMGLIFIYGDLIPHLLLIFLRTSRTKGRYYQKYLKLERFLKNIGVDQLLNEKVEKYFSHFWLSGMTGEEMENLMMDLPLALKKEIFTDIYWDAFRHSDLFRDVSRSCKRSMSLVMTTEHCQEGDVIWMKNGSKNKMIYLVEGVLELMAAENENSPIMSFSSGTILGEMSLFWVLKSQATIKCRTLCEIQTLFLRDMYRVLLNYPKDRNIVFQKFNKRLAIGKITQWRKRRIALEKMIDPDFSESHTLRRDENEDRVKWVKLQWRAIWELHERHMLVMRAQEGGLRIPGWRKQYEIQTRLDTVSNYMDLMVLSDVMEEKKDVVCLKTVFPWAIDPKAEFLRVWRNVVVVAAIISSVAYPFCCGWLDDIPQTIFTTSIACSIIFEIDLALLLMTAVKTKHGIFTDFTTILMNNVKKPTFYMDVMAALPIQLYKHFNVSSAWLGYLLLPCVLKAHVFLQPKTAIGDSMVFTCIVKNIFFLLLLIYWFAAIIQLTSMRCFPVCAFFKWDNNTIQFLDQFFLENILSASLAVATALRLTDHFAINNTDYMLSVTVASIFFFFWICYFLGDFYTVYSIKINNHVRFMILYGRIMQYLENVQISSLIQKRIVHIVRFQWAFNEADDLLTRSSALELAPKSLRREIFANSVYRSVRRCSLFQNESSEFIYDTIERCEIIAVPSGTILVNYGVRCNRIHLLHKGYCQTTSFLTKDVSGGLGAPLLIKPGDIFPPLAPFASTSTPMAVISLTDCVIIVFQLEDVLKAMITHGIFKDFLDVLQSSNVVERLSRHTFGMIPVNVQFNAPIDKKEEYDAPFRGLGMFGFILKRILFHRDIFFDENQQQKQFYKIISLIYVFYLVLMAFLWPLCFGLLMYQSPYIIPTLTCAKIFILFYIYLQFHVPYFDERGLLIKHPLYTMKHYITTNFFLDMVMNFPIYSIYRYYYATPGEMDNHALVFITMLQKLLGLLPINGYFSTVRKQSGTAPLDRNLYALILGAVLNTLANFDMYWNVLWKYDDEGYVVGFLPLYRQDESGCRSREEDEVVFFYFTILFWLFGQLTANNSLCETYFWVEGVYAMTLSFIGSIVTWIIIGWLASRSAVSDAIATVYQERMKSFIEFLISSKTDDKIVERSIGYFEHQWSRSRGQNLREICERLPHHLHEELAYPLYRPTLSKVTLFSNADESFYAMLSTNLDLVHFNRGSIILTRGQIQYDVFFVHSGKCFVFDWFLTLDIGSMIGDLNQTGMNVNQVFALTHVELLRIKSEKFFNIINNYYEIEKRFLSKEATMENFMKSQYIHQQLNQLRPVDSRDVLNAFDLQSKDLGFEDQSYFEDPENITTQKTLSRKQIRNLQKFYSFTIYPGTFPMVLYNIVNFTVALLTVITTPSLLFFGGLTLPAYVITAVLDGLWALGVFATFRVGIEDKLKGDVITDGKFIAKMYFLSLDGFFLRLICCLPFELIPIAMADNPEEDLVLISCLRSLRLIRVYFLIKYLLVEVKKLKVSNEIRYMSVIIFYILYIHVMVLLFLMITTNEEITQTMTPMRFGSHQWNSILQIYHFVINIATSTNMLYLFPESMLEMFYFNIFSVVSIYTKALIITNILSIKYIHNLARGKHKSQVTLLENYLKGHDLSPSILREVLDYKQNLLIVARSENNPTFLLKAPEALRIAIMSDLYLARLKNSPIFSEVNSSFLKLLVCRLKRQIYFPGQKIVEKGDVDDTMYFIHKGEVYVVDQTNEEAYIEFVVDRIFPGDEFGQAQGLFKARPHTNTYRARTIVEILTLNSHDWFDLKQCFPTVYTDIIETSKKFL